MNPLIIDLGGTQIRHGSRTQRGEVEHGWSASESIRLAIEELTEDPPHRHSLHDVGHGFDANGRGDFAWWPLTSGGAGRQFFGGVRPLPDLPAEPPLPEFPFAADPPSRLDIEDFFQVFHRGWTTRSHQEIQDGQARAIATLGSHSHFQTNPGIRLETKPYQLLEVIVFYHGFWLRRVADWTPPEGDAFSCIRDLFAHLFFRYNVPRWLDPRGGPADREWDDPNWLTLAIFNSRGGSIHEGLAYLAMDQWGQPLLTRRGVRRFTEAPRELQFWDAIRYALILDSGGDLAAVQDFQAFGDRIPLMYAAPVVRALAPWLTQNREGISPGMGVLMIHWAHAKYREFRRRQADAHNNAPQRTRPRAFTIQRRSLRSVIAEILTNLAEFRNPLCKHMAHHTWPSHAWDRTLKIADVEWIAREICTVGELAREGIEMRHCAIQCLTSCATGQTTVVSMTSSHGNRVTLQVCPETLDLLQIRGAGNRDPSPGEQFAAETWHRHIRTQDTSGGASFPSTINLGSTVA